MDYEKDKIVLIQCTTLLAYWFIDSADRTGSWHWIGIAISLCHSAGLHRNFQRQPSMGLKELVLWRIVWWCCYYREAWISYGMGRPMRIHLDDCDVPFPTVEDVLKLSSPKPCFGSYLSKGMPSMARSWIKLLRLSVVLGKVHLTHYKVNGPRPTTTHISEMEQELIECSEHTAERVDPAASPLVRLVSLQLQVIEKYPLNAPSPLWAH